MTDTKKVTESVSYERIVVPLDLSDRAEQALPHALSLAKALGAPVHLLNVVDITPLAQATLIALGVDDLAVAAALSLVEAEMVTATAYLEEVGRRLAAQGVTPTIEVRQGLIVPELLAAVRSSDLLVMATHGGTGMARWFIGDEADAVIKRSPAPVLVVRSAAAHAAVSDTSDVAA